MKGQKLALLAWLFSLAHSVAAQVPVAEHKTLTRFHDPVILSTAALAPAADRRTAQHALYRFESRTFQPIPFQFDRRDEEGEFVLSESGAVDAFVFDQNDELVFMAKDSGDRAGDGVLVFGADGGFEIEVANPPSAERGWVYLFHFPGERPPGSPAVYAVYDIAANEARTPLYTIAYAPERNFFTGLSIATATGQRGENILDRMKIRVQPTFGILFAKWSPLFTEEDFTVRFDGFKNGPVRATRRVRQSLDLGGVFPEVPGGTVYTHYYFSSFVTPSQFSIPWLVLTALRDFRFSGASDFRSSVIGMTYWDGANPRGVQMTGRNDLDLIADRDHDWWVIGGPQGACLHAFVIPDEWRKWGVARGTVFIDDSSRIDSEGAEAEVGSHTAGYSLLNMEKLRRAGNYDMQLAMIILPHEYRLGDEAEPLAMLKAPLQASARPLAASRPGPD